MAIAPKVVIAASTVSLLLSLALEYALNGLSTDGVLAWTDVLPRAALFGTILFTLVWILVRYRVLGQLADKNPKSWEYAAEGALNVAVRYRGNARSLKGKVLRLRKKPWLSRIKSSSSALSDGDVLDDDFEVEDDDLEGTLVEANAFVEEVIVPLLSRRFVPPAQVVRVNAKFLEDLAKHIDPSRPEKRRDAAGLNRNARVGLLMKDSAQIACGCTKSCPSFCFEIKPKWGFLTQEKTEWDVKRRVDRFTMHQYLKKSQDDLDHISRYCPLDLFQKGAYGIRTSLQRLETTPQNNLRLFINGTMVFPDKQKTPLAQVMGGERARDDIFDAITEALTKEDVLKRVLEAQTLGPLNDIESVYPIYQDLLQSGYEFSQNGPLRFRTDYTPQVPPETDEDKLECVKRFMVACTARDCSIMLTFSECASPQRVTLGRCCDGRWGYEITVVDLDAKPVQKMHHYFTVDRDIARNYTEKVEGRKVEGATAPPWSKGYFM